MLMEKEGRKKPNTSVHGREGRERGRTREERWRVRECVYILKVIDKTINFTPVSSSLAA